MKDYSNQSSEFIQGAGDKKKFIQGVSDKVTINSFIQSVGD